jgi:hypothetical protein
MLHIAYRPCSAEAMIEAKYEITHADFEKSLMEYANRRELQEIYMMMQVSSSLLFVLDFAELIFIKSCQ